MTDTVAANEEVGPLKIREGDIYDPLTAALIPLDDARWARPLSHIFSTAEDAPQKTVLYNIQTLREYYKHSNVDFDEDSICRPLSETEKSSLSVVCEEAARFLESGEGQDIYNGLYRIIPLGLHNMLSTTVRDEQLAGIGTISEWLGMDRTDTAREATGDSSSAHSTDTRLNYKTPSVVMIGLQSTGKSLLLSRFLSRQIFPVGLGRCTLMPILFKMRTGAAQVPRIVVVRVAADGTRKPIACKVTQYACREPGMRETELAEDFVPIAMLEAAIAERMSLLCPVDAENNHKHVSLNHEIEIYLQAPNFPNMDLVDLPGIVQAADAERTKELALRFLMRNRDSSLVVLVQKMLTCKNLEVEPPYQIISTANVLHNTSAVYTWGDFVSPKVYTGYARKGLKSMPFGVSIVAAGPKTASSTAAAPSSGPEMLEGLKRFHDLSTREMDFFNKLDDQAKEAFASQFGINATITNIKKSFEAYLCISWVSTVIHRICSNLYSFELAIDDMGFPFTAFEGEAECIDERKHLSDAGMPEIGEAARSVTSKEVSDAAVAQLVKMLTAFPFAKMVLELVSSRIIAPFTSMEKLICTQYIASDENAYTAEELHTALDTHDLVKTMLITLANDACEEARGGGTDEQPPLSAIIAGRIKDYLVADPSSVKLGRFTTLIDAVMSDVETMLQEELDAKLVEATLSFSQFLEAEVESLVSLNQNPATGAFHIAYKYAPAYACGATANPFSTHVTLGGFFSARIVKAIRGLTQNTLAKLAPAATSIFEEDPQVSALRAGRFEEMKLRHKVIRYLMDGRKGVTQIPHDLDLPVDEAIQQLPCEDALKESLMKLAHPQAGDAPIQTLNICPGSASFDNGDDVADFERCLKIISATKGPAELRIESKHLSDKMVVLALKQVLRRQFNTEHMTLTGTLSEEAFEAVCDSLKQNVTMKTLRLTQFVPTPRSAELLTGLFAENTFLTLSLPQTGWESAGKKVTDGVEALSRRTFFDFLSRRDHAINPVSRIEFF